MTGRCIRHWVRCFQPGLRWRRDLQHQFASRCLHRVRQPPMHGASGPTLSIPQGQCCPALPHAKISKFVVGNSLVGCICTNQRQTQWVVHQTREPRCSEQARHVLTLGICIGHCSTIFQELCPDNMLPDMQATLSSSGAEGVLRQVVAVSPAAL